jgi:hypothetical protein
MLSVHIQILSANVLHSIYIYCLPLLHVWAMNFDHLQGNAGVFDVYSVYGILLYVSGTLYTSLSASS